MQILDLNWVLSLSVDLNGTFPFNNNGMAWFFIGSINNITYDNTLKHRYIFLHMLNSFNNEHFRQKNFNCSKLMAQDVTIFTKRCKILNHWGHFIFLEKLLFLVIRLTHWLPWLSYSIVSEFLFRAVGMIFKWLPVFFLSWRSNENCFIVKYFQESGGFGGCKCS